MATSSQPIKPQCHGAFSLLEVVLAIALTSVVIALLMTAVNQFMIRVDTGRTQVETAQLARTLLKQIADDLRAVRYAKSPAESSPNNSSTSPTNSAELAQPAELSSTSTQDNSTSDSTSASSADSTPSASITPAGIVGTQTELLITRSGAWRWERLTEQLETQSSGIEDEEAYYALMAQVPQTVRYFVREGDEVSTAKLAAAGVEEKPAENIAGLCRERVATNVALSELSSELSDSDTESISASDMLEGSFAELLAPEVIDLQLAYFYGSEFYDDWNTAKEGMLPQAVEIRLTLLKQPNESDAEKLEGRAGRRAQHSPADTVEYQLIVRLPEVQAARTIPVVPAPQAANASQQPSSSVNTENEKRP